MRPLAKQIAVFLLLVFAFSSLPYYLMIHTGHIGAGNGLVVAQIAGCLVLLVVAGVLLRGSGRARVMDPGFRSSRVVRK